MVKYIDTNHQNFSEEDMIAIYVPTMKALNVPDEIVNTYMPKIEDIEKGDLDRYISLQTQMYGNDISGESEAKIIQDLAKISTKQLPSIARTLIDSKVENQHIWDKLREVLLERVRK